MSHRKTERLLTMLYEIEYERTDANEEATDFSNVVDAPRWQPIISDGGIRFGKGVLKAIADYGRANGARVALIHEYTPLTVQRDGYVVSAHTSLLAEMTISSDAGLGYSCRQPNGRTAR